MSHDGRVTAGSHDRRPGTIRQRGPVRTAVLSLVTMSLYGFWWWREVNRQLRALGQPADPGRALAAVTTGWLALIPPFLSVHRTATMIAAVQRRGGLVRTVNPAAAVAIAAVAGAGAIAWFALAFPRGVLRHRHRYHLAADRDGVRRLYTGRTQPGHRPADSSGIVRAGVTRAMRSGNEGERRLRRPASQMLIARPHGGTCAVRCAT
jgi:hypothetical protein